VGLTCQASNEPPACDVPYLGSKGGGERGEIRVLEARHFAHGTPGGEPPPRFFLPRVDGRALDVAVQVEFESNL
jgi:hypothetical protein